MEGWVWKEKEVNLIIQEKVAKVSTLKKFTISPESHHGDIYIQTSFKFARCFFQLLLNRGRTLAAILFIHYYASAFIFYPLWKIALLLWLVLRWFVQSFNFTASVFFVCSIFLICNLLTSLTG